MIGDVLIASAFAALLAAVLVDLRHRTLHVAVAQEPWTARSRRTQFLFETWALTTPSLVLLAFSQTHI
jgi:hypothetical protein